MPYYDDQISQDARFTLAHAVDDAVSDFLAAFRKHWGLDDSAPPRHLATDDWLTVKKLSGEAEKAADVASTLIRRQGADKLRADAEFMDSEAATLQSRVEELKCRIEGLFPNINAWQLYVSLAPSDIGDARARHAVFQTLIQHHALKQFQPDLSVLASRICSLLGYLVRYPNQRAAEYLGRVARCYLLDLPVELAVMARATLDVALQEIVPDTEIQKHFGRQVRERVGLAVRLEYFKGLALLKDGAATAADRLKEAGDAAAHGRERQFTADSLLTDLAEVLTALDPLQPGPRAEQPGR